MKYAITGGIGCGKSYVCKVLKSEYGIEVYDCDAAAKRLMREDKLLQRKLTEAVGQEVFPGGVLDKALLSQFLLKSEENNGIVNSIVHPTVAADFLNSGLDWMESAILFESGFDKYVDRVVCVSAPESVRVERIMKRDGISREQALEWIHRQMPQELKEQRADYVIVNDGCASLSEEVTRCVKTVTRCVKSKSLKV